MQSLRQSRGSKQRTAILHVLAGTDSHPNAEWVYQQVSREIPNISLGTVYRNLAYLAQLGEIQRMEVGDGIDRFDFNETPHYHMYCNTCRRLFDFSLPYDADLDALAETHCGGKILNHSLIFYGECRECHVKKEKESSSI